MKRRIAIIGLGRVGKACAEAIAASDDLAAAGVVRRPQSIGQPLPQFLRDVPVAAHASELRSLDVALICLPTPLALEPATDSLRHGIPIIEAAAVPDAEYRSYRRKIDQIALQHHVAAVVGAGWSPGMLALLSGVFSVLCPKGHTEMRDRPGVSLHHTLAARSAGVKDALCAELRAGSGKIQRYVYIELKPGADLPSIHQAIESDPLFLDEETLVLPVDSIAALEDEGHGVVIERWGTAAGKAHQRFLLEGRFDRVAVTGQIMVAAARALPTLAAGAHMLADLPLSKLSHQFDEPPAKGRG
jgi:diaminopimelate dehydrogenase